MLTTELDTLQVAAELGEGKKGDIRVIELDVSKTTEKLGRFRKTAVLLQALESSPSRDRVVAWVKDTMEIRLGVQISQVKALGQKEFLIVFASEEDRPKVAWVELQNLPPFLQDQAEQMLAAIGQVVHHSLDKQDEMRYANVRGCFLVDDGQTMLEVPVITEKVQLPIEAKKYRILGVHKSTKFKRLIAKTQSLGNSDIDPLMRDPDDTVCGDKQSLARRGRAPKKKEEGKSKRKNMDLGWLDGEGSSNGDEPPRPGPEVSSGGSRRVLGELDVNRGHMTQQGSLAMDSEDEIFCENTIREDGLLQVRQVLEKLSQVSGSMSGKENQ
ncbi:hypothetical protein R1sor_011484 [Riccia sorocarpa]|uniref:Uncharacterized protein n=1 Tax=Riccia sorocarpa TaxID=122646 RepID=A0ABD3I112_9MARC